MSSAMVLCAGYGTRLRPLTCELPKPLVPVGDRSVLSHIVGRLVAAGFEQYVINVHHLAHVFPSELGALPIEAHVIEESEIRGTAGGVAGARAALVPPVLVWNGDILANPPVAPLLDRAARHGIALAVARRGRGEGTVGLGAKGEIVRIRGKRYGREVAGADYIGICGIGASVLAALPERGCLIGDWVLPALERGEAIPTCVTRHPWEDLGDAARYHALNMRWLEARSGDSYVGPGATLEPGITVRASVVGAGASIAGAGHLERCVVWPKARVEAPLSNAIVTTEGVVVAI